jgi:hypothetical protein
MKHPVGPERVDSRRGDEQRLPVLLTWIAVKVVLLLLLLDATKTVVLYQNY